MVNSSDTAGAQSRVDAITRWERIFQSTRARSVFMLVFIGLLAAIMFLADLSLPLGVAAGVPYVALILVGWWLDRVMFILALAVLSTGLTGAGYLYSMEGGIPWMVAANRLLAVFAIWTTALLLALFKRSQLKNHGLLSDLRSEIAHREIIERQLQETHQEMEMEVEDRTHQLREEIEERRQTEGELHRFKATLDQTQDCVFIFRADDLVFTYVNKGAIEQVGYPEAEMMSMTPLDIKPEFTETSFRAMVAPLMEGEAASHMFETVHRHKDGSEVPVEIVLQYLAPAGEDPRFVAVVRDVTGRKKTEARLQESELKYRNLIEGSIQGIAIIQNLVLKFANRALADIYGYSSHDAIIGGHTLDLFIAPHERERIEGFHLRRMKGEIVPDRYEFQGLRVDGRLIWLEGLAKMVLWDGEPAAQVTYFDITERKALQEQLLQSQKMEAIGQLAGGVAHEFNNMLQVIKGHTQMAMALPEIPPNIADHLSKVNYASTRAADLTQYLLAFGREQQLTFKPFDLVLLIQNQISLLRQIIGENIEISTRNQVDQVMVNGDSGMLEQVLMNLCINARDAMPEGGDLSIEIDICPADTEFQTQKPWAREKEYGLVTVRDSGSGMTQEVLTHIFDPFFTTKEVGKGSGLGLSMAYGIITQHAGMIEVESHPGEGTVFCMYLPLCPVPEPSPPPAEAIAVNGGTETVLVVEDEKEVLEMVAEILADHGYQVRKAINGQEGLDLLMKAGNGIDLALIDLVMPKMGGWELFQRIKENSPEFPIIICTGYDSEGIDKTQVAEHRIKVLQKPYVVYDLLLALRDALDAVPSHETLPLKPGLN